MLGNILFGIGMLVITIAIQLFLYKSGKNLNFWRGSEPVFIMCLLGILFGDGGYLYGILGYVIGDYIGQVAGWHIPKSKE